MPTSSEIASASAETACTTGNGTGVFIPQCILDGSALSDPRIMNKPLRKRRGSANQSQSEPKHGSSNGKQSQKQQQQQEKASAVGSISSSGTSTAKNPFAATPKNIRQQQLLCNLVAAADCFSEAAGAPLPPTAVGASSSRAASVDLSSQQQMLAGAGMRGASFDMIRSSSRTSLDSSCFYYSRSSMDVSSARPSVDMNSARPSMDQSCRSSFDCRASMDPCSSYGRPSIESTFSCYAATTAGTTTRSSLDMPGSTVGLYSGSTGSAGRATLDISRRPALDLGSRPLAGDAGAGNKPQQRSHSLDISRRMSLEMAAAAASGQAQRISLDNSDCNNAWSHWPQAKQQQQASRMVRRDSSSISNGSAYSSGSGTVDGQLGRLPSPDMATAAALAAQQAAAAAAAASGWDIPTQAALLQLHQQMLLDGNCGLTNGNGMAAAAAATLLEQQLQQVAQAQQQQQQGLMLRAGSTGSPPAPFKAGANVPVTAALPPAGPSRGGSSNASTSNSPAQMQQAELNLIQQQLQQIIQANQMAAAAQAVSAAAVAAGQAASMQQRQQRLRALQMLQLQDTTALQQLLEQQANDIAGSQSADEIAFRHQMAAAASRSGQSSSLDSAVNAVSLQQQLEMLQMLQL